MEIYSFRKDVGKRINHFSSDFIMSRVINTHKPAHVGQLHILFSWLYLLSIPA